MISIVCQTFAISPREAEQQDWALVQAIMDYRAAQVPLDLMKQGEAGAKVIAAHPDLLRGLDPLRAAQQRGPSDFLKVARLREEAHGG